MSNLRFFVVAAIVLIVISFAPAQQKDSMRADTTIPTFDSNLERELERTPYMSSEPSALDSFPKLIHMAQAKYPESARRSWSEGTVYVKLIVSADGTPKNPHVVKSDDKVFNVSAIKAAMLSKFSPGIYLGKPVPVLMTIPIRFRLNKPHNKQ